MSLSVKHGKRKKEDVNKNKEIKEEEKLTKIMRKILEELKMIAVCIMHNCCVK